MSAKYALIIGNTEYTDPGLAKLTAPSADAKDFARILRDPRLCAFDEVKVCLNQRSSSVIEQIDAFFDNKKIDDLLVLYFSGHGIRDELGALYLAFKNTVRTRLRSTSIKADYVREAMDQSRSKRQILILDCCNSGAFPQGTKAEVGGSMGLMTAFQGYGRYVLTASDATQFAWEGAKIIGSTDNSLFTHFLVQGLEQGAADQDGDGRITVDDLYEYAFEEISRVTPNQTPTKSASRQAGEIVLRQITRIEDIKAISLPDELTQATVDPRPFVREGAVEPLQNFLHGKNLGLARSAKEALEKLAAKDDSLRVRQAAERALGTLRTVELPAQGEKRFTESIQVITPAASRSVQPKVPAVPDRVVERPARSRLESLATGPLMLGAAGVLIVVVAVTAALLLRPRAISPNKPASPLLASKQSPSQAALGLPVTAASEATALTTVPSAPLPTITLAPTALPVVVHLKQPPDLTRQPELTYADTSSVGPGAEGRASDESYQRNRLERPFLQNMTYVPDLDILTFGVGQDETWNYVSLGLAGNNPDNALGIDYGVEIDLNDDSYGDYLIWAHAPYTDHWQTSTVLVFKDTNHDTRIPSGDGYDTVIFDGSVSQNTDPDLAWVRLAQGQQTALEFAFKRSLTKSSFLFGVLADAGLRDITKFDYGVHFTLADAGSPVKSNQYFPLKALYAVDNSCWLPYKYQTTGSELKVCPATKSGGAGAGGGTCNPKPVCQNGYNPSTCQCYPGP